MERNDPPRYWSDLGWRDKLRLRVPDLLGLACVLVLFGAVAMRIWWV